MRRRFWATMRRPAFSMTALTAPVRFRFVASGLMIEKVRSRAIGCSGAVGDRGLIAIPSPALKPPFAVAKGAPASSVMRQEEPRLALRRGDFLRRHLAGELAAHRDGVAIAAGNGDVEPLVSLDPVERHRRPDGVHQAELVKGLAAHLPGADRQLGSRDLETRHDTPLRVLSTGPLCAAIMSGACRAEFKRLAKT